MIVAIANLEHQLDRAILSIDDLHPAWLLEEARKPPMKVGPKAAIVAKFAAENPEANAGVLPADFGFLVCNMFELRNVLLHGRLRGWEEPIETIDAAMYVTRLVVKNKDGKSSMSLSTAVVDFAAVRELTNRAWHFAQLIREVVPPPKRHDADMEARLGLIRAQRSTSQDVEVSDEQS